MKCKRFEMLIAQYVEGDLPAGKVREVESHLAICASCREFTDGLRLSQEALKTLGYDEVPSVSLDRVRAEVMKSVANEPLRRSGNRWQFALAAAFVIAVGAAVLWHVRQSRPVVVSNAGQRMETGPPQTGHRSQAKSKTTHRTEAKGEQLATKLPMPAASSPPQHATRQGLAHPNRTKLAERESHAGLRSSDEETGVPAQPLPLPSESSITRAKTSTVPAVKVKLLTNDPNVVIYLIVD
jgi:anti-sigma factor RsiW